jgi:hypothetical protein
MYFTINLFYHNSVGTVLGISEPEIAALSAHFEAIDEEGNIIKRVLDFKAGYKPSP